MRGILVRGIIASGIVVLGIVGGGGEAWAQQRRAPPPEFNWNQLRGIFFDDLREAFPGERPTLAKIRSSATPVAASASASGDATKSAAADPAADRWSKLIAPTSLEDEVKRVRLRYDATITQPAAFISGGYQKARVDLSALAMLFAVINEHTGDVRWKDQAAAARDLIARTAYNCKAGSTQVYNEAKLRKGDLEDLVSGSGLSVRDAAAENDWSSIADRTPLMTYLEELVDDLANDARNENSIKSSSDELRRRAQLIAVVGEVLVQEGMIDADDRDYSELSQSMTQAAHGVAEAVERMDFEAVRQGASLIRQRCDACHEQYR